MSYQRAILLQALAALLLSTGGLLIKVISVDPLALVGARGLVAAGVIALFMGRPRFRLTVPQIGGALALVGAQIFFVIATRETTAANAIFIQYTAPIYVAFFGIWYLKEPARRRDWITIGAIGIGFYLFFADSMLVGGVWGNVSALLSGISFAWFILFLRKQGTGSNIETFFLGNLLAGLLGLPALLQASPTAMDWAGIAFLGVFQLGLAFILMSIAVRRLSAVDTVLIQTLEPLLNPVWVFLVISESPSPMALVGGLIVLSAVSLRSLYTARSRHPRPAAALSG